MFKPFSKISKIKNSVVEKLSKSAAKAENKWSFSSN